MRDFEDILLSTIQSVIGKSKKPGVRLGIGDDCAVFKIGKQTCVATTDALVEGLHFDRSYFNAKEIGGKSLAVNLSDIAAMGAIPKFALVSLGVPGKEPLKWIRELYQGMKKSADAFGVAIVGGNITRTPKITIDVALIGESQKRIATRSGAHRDDMLCVTGNLGSAAAGLALLQRRGPSVKKSFPMCTRAQLIPVPRVNLMRELVRQGLVTAALDISDGLCTDARRLAESSRVGLRIDIGKLPMHREMLRAATLLKRDPLDWALDGGEDYEILMTISPRHFARVCAVGEEHGVRITAVGVATASKKKTIILSPSVTPRVHWNAFLPV